MGKINSKEYISDFIEQYQNLVFSICYKMTQDYFASQDLTQETFLSAYRHKNHFQEGNEKAWICRIAANKCIDYLREAARRQIPTEETQMECNAADKGLPEREMLEEEVRDELKANCRQLKEPYSQIAYQYFYLEKRPEEIARQQNQNIKTIQTQIYRARDMLRKLYRERHGEQYGR